MKISNKFLRGKLLGFMYHVYPDGLPEEVIIQSYYEYHHPDELIVSLEYLTDKGYAQKKETQHPYKQGEVVRWYKVLPKGIDLVEGVFFDETIAIPKGE